MAVRIRLKRTGRRNRPFYRICVFDGRTRRDGAPIEELGSYDPRGATFADKVQLKKVRAHHWLGVGALPTETVASILRKAGVRKDGPVPVEDEPQAAETAAAPAEAAPAEAASTDD
ncbi:MAG: hypothetical protein DHS20C15_00310 [Planctomycetota bacterium]|nr:MAG: hypothetical protein DHS20C15_00310 [Planctomycetota bacterium]